MAWNEPGDGKDPWGGNRGNQGPPDIDEAIKKLRSRINKLFGGVGGRGKKSKFLIWEAGSINPCYKRSESPSKAL